jgi:DNA-binding LacI/PurR family transcriptional regulator
MKNFDVTRLLRNRDEDAVHAHGHERMKVLSFTFFVLLRNGEDRFIVVVEDHRGTFDVVNKAVAIGYRNIGCIGGGMNVNIGKNRLAGFRAALEQHGIPVNPDWILNGGFGKEAGYNGFMQLYNSRNMPEFIFAMTYPIALGIYEAARKTGVRIPQDVDVVCFGDSDVSDIISPALSCVKQPSYDLGVKAVELLFESLKNPEARERQIVLPTELILRETCVRSNGAAINPASLLNKPLERN